MTPRFSDNCSMSFSATLSVHNAHAHTRAHTKVLVVEMDEILVFAHDFCHCGEKDEVNSRMFLGFSHTSSVIASNNVYVV